MISRPSQACPMSRSDQTEPLVLLHGVHEPVPQGLFGLVAGHVQHVITGVSNRQVVLFSSSGLDDYA